MHARYGGRNVTVRRARVPPGSDLEQQRGRWPYNWNSMTEYIEQREGGYYVAGTRVSLDSLVYAFHVGESPETIQQQFPSLSLEQVYGAIAFYLGHQAEVDTNIREGEEQIKLLVPPLSQRKPEAFLRLQRAREQMPHGSGASGSRLTTISTD